MTVNQENTTVVIQAVLRQEETNELLKLASNEPNLGFLRHLMIAQHLMGTVVSGVLPQSLINQLINEYSKNQWSLLSRLMVQVRLGKTLDLRSFQDMYQETIWLQIQREFKRHKGSVNSGDRYQRNKEIRLTAIITPENIQEMDSSIFAYRESGILRYWLFTANLIGIKPDGWHDDQKDLLSELQSVLNPYKQEHCKQLQRLLSLVKSGKPIFLKEVSLEQEERLASMMKILGGLLMFPVPR